MNLLTKQENAFDINIGPILRAEYNHTTALANPTIDPMANMTSKVVWLFPLLEVARSIL